MVDDLAAEGLYLLVLRGENMEADDETCLPYLELPAIRDVGQYLGLLEMAGAEAASGRLRGLVLTGFPPPVDGSVAWMTVTPDPAVVEINMAPARNAAEFHDWVKSLFQAAEQSPSRLIDSSTQRVEWCLRVTDHSRQSPDRWRLAAADWRIPARHEQEGHDNLLVCGIRYRAFQPWRGLHPGLAPQAPVQLRVSNESTGQDWRITLHEWKPDGGGYEGLPKDAEESRRRRRERVVVEAEAQESCAEPRVPPGLAVTPYGLDLRACPQVR